MSLSKAATQTRLIAGPCSLNSRASCIKLLQVQRGGDGGSPLDAGSTKRSSASCTRGFRSTRLLRPAPGRLTRRRPSGSAGWGDSISLIQAKIDRRATPVAKLTYAFDATVPQNLGLKRRVKSPPLALVENSFKSPMSCGNQGV